MVLGEKKRLVQVLANLLGNAARYTPNRGQIKLCVGVNDEDVEVTVGDNGIGMSEECALCQTAGRRQVTGVFGVSRQSPKVCRLTFQSLSLSEMPSYVATRSKARSNKARAEPDTARR